MNWLKKIWVSFKSIHKNDPVKKCTVYKKLGCSHVDGYLCNFETCSIRHNQELFDMEQELDIPFNLRYYNK